MYENGERIPRDVLNNNMGCIEIAFRDCNQDHKMWLNNNMGSIEIYKRWAKNLC